MVESSPMRKLIAVLVTMMWVLLGASSALAHGDYVDSSPKPDEVLDAVPAEITVTLSEPPTKDSSIVAKDPCGNTVESVSVSNNDIIAVVSPEAHPGDWRIKWETISAVDGHSTTGTFKFSVTGDADCTEEEPLPEPTTPETGPEDDTDDTSATDAESDDDGFPFVPVVLGGVVLIALGAVGRRFGSR
ncbi:MAG: hypothetical protein GEU71_10760 [Actinobacteria bacterium]|nr:hypothetical protein [Actinomycetota bacterium]